MNNLKVIMKTLPIGTGSIVTRTVPSLRNLVSIRYDKEEVYLFFLKEKGEPLFTKEFLFSETNAVVTDAAKGHVVPLITVFNETNPSNSLHLFCLIRTEEDDEETPQDDEEKWM